MTSFVVTYSKSKGLRSVVVAPDSVSAVEQQMEWERTPGRSEDIIVIALDSDSLANLVKTHGRFFC